MITMTVDSIGDTEPPVTAHSARVKGLSFESDPRIALFLGDITDLGHPEERWVLRCSGARSIELKLYFTKAL